jgi:uncharacterized membrane protein YbhN (UPF0104 family)
MSTASAESARRRYSIAAFKLLVSIALLALLFSRIDVSRLWLTARTASLPWLGFAFLVYASLVNVSVWRWRRLLRAQDVEIGTLRLTRSYLVALFFNNFLPSNIGGDVVRIRDTARPAGSTTLATTVVLVDRAIGLMGLGLVAACGASLAAESRAGRGALPILPVWLWTGFLAAAAVAVPAVVAPAGFGRLLRPLRLIHPEWIGRQIDKLTAVLARFRDRPGALASCFGAAVVVQAGTVAFYLAAAYALRIPIAPWDLAVIVPLSFLVQMVPVSINGFGVREATFSLYFSRLGLPIEYALLVSLVPTSLVMLFSLSGAAVYVTRRSA